MRISDWSSDVCSSDLDAGATQVHHSRLASLRQKLKRRISCRSDASRDRRFRTRRAARAVSGSATRNRQARSEEHTSELQSLMRISYAVFCLKKKTTTHTSKYQTLNNILYTLFRIHNTKRIQR